MLAITSQFHLKEVKLKKFKGVEVGEEEGTFQTTIYLNRCPASAAWLILTNNDVSKYTSVKVFLVLLPFDFVNQLK